jgi:hypothetical protein
MRYSIRYSIQYSMHCDASCPNGQQISQSVFHMTGCAIMFKLPLQSFFFDSITIFVAARAAWTRQRSPETLNSHLFMASLIASLSLQHPESLFYLQYSHREAYTGDGHSRVHGVFTIALANPPT